MGKQYEQLDERLIDFIARQRVFFVGTAPSASDGHLNISPKGLDTFRILGPSTVAYVESKPSPTCARTDASRSCSAPSRDRP
jgi:hypothetical protein